MYTSSLLRAVETAAIIAVRTGTALRSDDRLREVGNARPDGSPIRAVALPPRFDGVRGSIAPDRPVGEGAESWRQFVARVNAFWAEVIHTGATRVVVVTHSGVIEAISDLCFGVASPRRVELAIHNTGITHWQLRDDPEPWLLHAHDLVHHLLRAAAPVELLSGAPARY
jgi:broad specificity phosphatase PhoE